MTDIDTTDVKPECNPDVHIFPATDRGMLAYFTRTGSIARVEDQWANKLSAIERNEVLVSELIADAEASGGQEHDDILALVEAGHLSADYKPSSGQGIDREGLHSHAPRNLMLLVTDTCNLQCTYCYELKQGVHAAGRNMRTGTVDDAITQYIRDSGRRTDLQMTFFGGEPLINFDLIQHGVAFSSQLAAAKGKTMAFTMTTNLTLLTEEIADFLVEHSFTVMVSIDGDEEDHDRHRVDKAGKGTHAKVVRNLEMLSRKLKDAGLRAPKLRATLMPGSKPEDEVHAYLSGLGTDLIELGQAGDNNEDEYAKVSFDPDTADAFRNRWENLSREVSKGKGSDLDELPPRVVKQLNDLHGKLRSSDPDAPVGPSLCGVCRNMKAVSAKGDLFPCHRYVGMDAFKLGTVDGGGAEHELVDSYYKKLEDSLGKACSKCWAHQLCGGICPWVLSSADGEVSAPEEDDCDQIRSTLESKLRLYSALQETAKSN